MLARLPMLSCAIALATGILAARLLPCPGWLPAVLLTGGPAAVAWLLLRGLRHGDGEAANARPLYPRAGILARAGPRAVLLATGLALAGYGLQRQQRASARRRQARALLPHRFQAEVLVIEPPEEGLATDKPGSWHRASGLITTVNGRRIPPVAVRLRGSGPRDFPRGSILRGQVLVERPPPPAFPGAFDYDRFLETRGLVASARFVRARASSANNRANRSAISSSPAKDARPYSVRRPRSPGWRTRIDRVRALAVRAILAHLPGPAGGFLAAAAFGYKVGLDREMKSVFQHVGIGHVLAISGLHVGLVAMICWWLASLFMVDPRKKALACILPCLAYLLLSGLRVPATRATVMLLIYLGGLILSRRGNCLNSLGTAALLLMLRRPAIIVDLGFLLSFAAVIFISRLGADLDLALGKRPTPQPRLPEPVASLPRRLLAGARDRLRSLLALSIAAWLGVTPLVAIAFHQINPVGLLANVVALPLMTCVLAGGILLEFAAWLLPVACSWLAPLAAAPANLLIAWAALLHRLPLGSLPVTPPPAWVSAVYYAAFAAWFMRRALPVSARLRARIHLGLLSLPGFAITLMAASLEPRPAPARTRVTLLPGRAGECAVIETAGGRVGVVGRITRKGADLRRYLACQGRVRVDCVLPLAARRPPALTGLADLATPAHIRLLPTRLVAAGRSGRDATNLPAWKQAPKSWRPLAGMPGAWVTAAYDTDGKLVWFALRVGDLEATVMEWSWRSALERHQRLRTPGADARLLLLRVKLEDEEARAANDSRARWTFLGHWRATAAADPLPPGRYRRCRFGALRLVSDPGGKTRLLAFDGRRWLELAGRR